MGQQMFSMYANCLCHKKTFALEINTSTSTSTSTMITILVQVKIKYELYSLMFIMPTHHLLLFGDVWKRKFMYFKKNNIQKKKECCLFSPKVTTNQKKKVSSRLHEVKVKEEKKEDLFRCILRDKDIEDY